MPDPIGTTVVRKRRRRPRTAPRQSGGSAGAAAEHDPHGRDARHSERAQQYQPDDNRTYRRDSSRVRLRERQRRGVLSCRDGSRGKPAVLHQAGAFQHLHVVHDEDVGPVGELTNDGVAGTGPNRTDNGENLAVGGPEAIDEHTWSN